VSTDEKNKPKDPKDKELFAAWFLRAFYISIILLVGSGVWAIADLIMPTGKLEALSGGSGAHVFAVAIAIFGFFMILWWFITKYNKWKTYIMGKI
jgi:hypothetical protein